ncbi:UNVERIFIED_CONTAM: hypothetical protein GTU68_038665 [Idotea baltica]|nr:hypothetical protein [Idotea baltica]
MVKKCIDLFAGCGGLSLGLEQAGFEPVFAVEQHIDAFTTYQRNLITDITQILLKYKSELTSLKGEIDLIAGGPPCQGFSMNGKRDPFDPRSSMVEAYLDFVKAVEPKMILMENVRGFRSMPHPTGGKYPAYVKKKLKSFGYSAFDTILAASDWGVPQKRPRYILIAVRDDIFARVNPIETLINGRKSYLTSLGLNLEHTNVEDALSDLLTSKLGTIADPEYGHRGFLAPKYQTPKRESAYLNIMRKGSTGAPSDMRLARHSLKVTTRMQTILNTCTLGQSLSLDDRKRLGIKKRSTTPLHPKKVAPTITTLPDDLIHYCEPRTMTVREHARIQSFPDWFSFSGRYTTGGARRKIDCPRYTQVGNAVPPLLARGIGAALIEILSAQDSMKFSNTSKTVEKCFSMLGEIGNSHENRSITV